MYRIEENGILMHKDRFYVPKYGDIRKMVLKEMHNVPCVGNLGYQKIVAVVRKQ